MKARIARQETSPPAVQDNIDKGNNVVTWTTPPRTFGEPTRPEQGATKFIRLGLTLAYSLLLPSQPNTSAMLIPSSRIITIKGVAPFLVAVSPDSPVETANQPRILTAVSAGEPEGAFVSRVRRPSRAIRLGDSTVKTLRERGESSPLESRLLPSPAAVPQS